MPQSVQNDSIAPDGMSKSSYSIVGKQLHATATLQTSSIRPLAVQAINSTDVSPDASFSAYFSLLMKSTPETTGHDVIQITEVTSKLPSTISLQLSATNNKSRDGSIVERTRILSSSSGLSKVEMAVTPEGSISSILYEDVSRSWSTAAYEALSSSGTPIDHTTILPSQSAASATETAIPSPESTIAPVKPTATLPGM